MINVSDLVGIPYKPHGRDENGTDCFGLIWIISFRLGKRIPDVPYKGFSPELMSLAKQMKVKQIPELEEGCVIEMIKDGKLHLGFSLDKENMIHCTFNEGVIVEPIGEYPIKGYWSWE